MYSLVKKVFQLTMLLFPLLSVLNSHLGEDVEDTSNGCV